MTLEQKIDICLEFIATTDLSRLPELKALARKALEASSGPSKNYYIEELLRELRVRKSLTGYVALVIAIGYAVDDDRYLWGLERLLYPIIAEKTNSDVIYVKRNITYAVQKTLASLDENTRRKLFGEVDHVTSREFLRGCADEVKRRMTGRI